MVTKIWKIISQSRPLTQKLMKPYKAILLLLILFSVTITVNAQSVGWTKEENEYYSKTKELCNYLKSNPYDTSHRNFIFDNYIFFVNPKKDTSQRRLNYFDMLFYHFYHFVDSIGLENLDAKPVRFFKSNEVFYKPYKEDLKWAETTVLAYYDKRNPDKPLGSLLYEPGSRKLVSWIILNMDGYLFLTPNLY